MITWRVIDFGDDHDSVFSGFMHVTATTPWGSLSILSTDEPSHALVRLAHELIRREIGDRVAAARAEVLVGIRALFAAAFDPPRTDLAAPIDIESTG